MGGIHKLRSILLGEKEAKEFVCRKCGFETNSLETFTLHKKNCPRILIHSDNLSGNESHLRSLTVVDILRNDLRLLFFLVLIAV